MTQTLQLKNDRREVAGLSQWVDRFAEEQKLSKKVSGNLQVALEEVALNVITHGYGEGGMTRHFTVSLALNGDYVTAEVTDDAAAFNPLNRAEVDTTLPLKDRPIGGLGIHLVKHLMDSIDYERRGTRNVLTLRCRRQAATETGGTEFTVAET